MVLSAELHLDSVDFRKVGIIFEFGQTCIKITLSKPGRKCLRVMLGWVLTKSSIYGPFLFGGS